MEHFPARRPCPLTSVPILAGVPDAQGFEFAGVTFVDFPKVGFLTFCDKLPARETIDPSFNSTVLVSHDLAHRFASRWPAAKLIRVNDPRAAFIDTLEYLRDNELLGASDLLPHAPAVSSHARIGAGTFIEAGTQVDAGSFIGNGVVIHAGTWIKSGVTVGDNCVIGGIGINAYKGRDGRRRGFPHLAGVIIGENANLGAGCVVVRGILSSTQIGADSIIGNLCNIGHGVDIGRNTWISVGTMVGGHTHIGNCATIAMGCVLRDNISIGEHASIGMGSVVTKPVRAGASVFGNPARTIAHIKAGPAR